MPNSPFNLVQNATSTKLLPNKAISEANYNKNCRENNGKLEKTLFKAAPGAKDTVSIAARSTAKTAAF